VKNKRDSGKSDKLSWHLAFYQAMQMELFDYFDDIEITFEHQLTSEPLHKFCFGCFWISGESFSETFPRSAASGTLRKNLSERQKSR
jgi:hypothetical protein